MEVTFSDMKQRRSLNDEKKEKRLSHCNSTAERRDAEAVGQPERWSSVCFGWQQRCFLTCPKRLLAEELTF